MRKLQPHSSSSYLSFLHSRSPRATNLPTSSDFCSRSTVRSRRRRRSTIMRFFSDHYPTSVAGGGPIVALLLLLLPIFSPTLFKPHGCASPSLFSVIYDNRWIDWSINESMNQWILCMLISVCWNRFDWRNVVVQEWNAPKPRHRILLEEALQRRTVSFFSLVVVVVMLVLS